jgi:glutathione peroxidase-family protein
MVGNISEEKLYYQDYNNVILLDPNKVFNADGKPVDRLVQHENLISYANLTCNVIPRTKLAVGENFNTEIRQVQLAKINFLRPSDKQFLDTTWTDELLGDYGNIGNTNKLNQTSEEQRKNLTNTNYDTQLLGITSISIRNNKIFIPEVTIELEDIQGRALFEKGEKSPYAAFFQLPYPLFELTVKGYYGKAVKYELNLVSFNARFNPGNGNYQISIKLVGRTPALFSDIDLTYMYALPYMYPATFYTDTTTNNQTTGDVAQDLQTQTTQGTTRGYQKLKEVYSVYKSKGLIPQDFPVMNLDQLRIKLDLLINQQLSSFGEENFSLLSDIARYEDDLQLFYNNIFGGSSSAWFNKWTTPTNYFISKTDATTRYYPIDSSGTTLTSIKGELQTLIDNYTAKL